LRLLALDTSTPSASLALLTAEGRIVPGAIHPGPRHGRLLVPSIHALLQSAGCRPADLDGVAVGLGPGSYTGLRIGVTAAKVLAFATRARLLPLDSMELIARNAPGDAARISVVADAQRHDLYVADFHRDGRGSPPTRSGSTRFESVAGWLASLQPGTIALGPGLQRLDAPLPDFLIPADPSWHHPRPDSLIAAAVEAFERGEDADWSLEPLYLRRSAAEDLWETRKAAASPRSDS
jgi:tRNA threonylcarbamoyladenosine biosynthesis protein TsaB